MLKNETIYDKLAEFGLSPDECDVYLLLLTEGSLTAKALASGLDVVVNSIYRVADALVGLGLVIELDVRPKQFQAVQPNSAIQKLSSSKARHLQNIGQELIQLLPVKQNPNRLNMELLTGRADLFEKFVELAKTANDEVLVISIGEPVPESIWSITQRLIEKDVKPKYLFHKYDKENILLVKRWLAMGVPIRHLPGAGYHLNIFDHSSVILSASNPNQGKERSGVVIYNEAIIEMLRTYFFQQWALAKRL